MNVVAIKELMWTYHPLPDTFKVVPFAEIKDANADVYVQANIKECKKEKKIGHIYNFVADSGKPWICVESAVFRRNMPPPPNPMAYHRYSWFSYFRDEGNYNNENCPGDRYAQIEKDQKLTVKDWRIKKGDYILVLLQRPGDSSLKNLVKRHGSYEGFITHTINEIKKYSDRPIRIRMHPLRQDRQLAVLEKLNLKDQISQNMQGWGILEGGKGLYEDFQNAYAVVGFNSNGLTESVMEGIPTFSMCPSSMAWEVSNKDLSTLENPEYFERINWLNNLAYCQWREDECKAGLPWEHLKKVYQDVISK
jgi:hypothetical protein